METKKCENCIFYKLFMQPDFLIKGEILNCCVVYNEGIPKEIWEEKKECKEYLEDLQATKG